MTGWNSILKSDAKTYHDNLLGGLPITDTAVHMQHGLISRTTQESWHRKGKLITRDINKAQDDRVALTSP